MNKFKTIDYKLCCFAIKLNATLSKDRPHFPREIVTFEERRIDWSENQIKKDFSDIEKQIDQLLTKSEQNLKSIKIKEVS